MNQNFKLFLAVFLMSFSPLMAKADSFGDPVIVCDPIDLGEDGILKLSVLDGESIDGVSSTGAAVMQSTDPEHPQAEPLGFDGFISIGKTDFSGNDAVIFTAKDKVVDLSVSTGSNSKITLKVFDDELQSWQTIFDGNSNCRRIQYESIASHHKN